MNDQIVTLNERFKAFLYHLSFSVVLLILSLFLILYVWYPGALKYATGVLGVYGMLLVIDLILGPMLTALVYKKHRAKFIFDMIIILIIQISAFLFGLYTLEKGRPAWLVFVIDDFEIVSKSDLDPQVVIPEQFKIGFLDKPMWVAAVYSDDPLVKRQQQEDEIFNGISLTTRPDSYKSIDLKENSILNKMQPLNKLTQYNSLNEQDLNDFKQFNGWLPLKAPEVDMVVFIDVKGLPTKIVNLRPWK
jgi:hypothetical protein